MMALPAAFFSGCSVGQVVPPFSPKEVNPEPYYPEAVWSANTDPTLLALQALKRLTGETMPPGSGTKAAAAAAGPTAGTAAAGTTSGTTPGGVTPVPGSAPGTPPASSRVWSPADPVWGYVLDRLTGVPIPGATVRLLNSLGSTLQTYTTSGDGGFSFKFSTAGYYKIDTVAGGYATIPPSSYNFYYGTTNLPQHNLELLSTGMPYLTLTGQSNFVEPSEKAILTTKAIGSPLRTYTGILFTAPSGVASEFYNEQDPTPVDNGIYNTYADYTFSLPIPSDYDIGYKDFWVTSEQYGPSSGNNWVTLTQDKVERQFYDWDDLTQQGTPGWVSIDRSAPLVFASSTTGYVPFWAINRTDGRVLMRICPRDPTVFVASVTLYYGFHEITMAPAISKCVTYPISSPNSIYLEIDENVYVQASTVSNWLPAYAGIAVLPWSSHPAPVPAWYHFDSDPGTGSTITVIDQANNVASKTVPFP